MPEMLQPLLTYADVIRLTRLSLRKLQDDKSSGALAAVQFGRATRFHPDDVAAYIERRRGK